MGLTEGGSDREGLTRVGGGGGWDLCVVTQGDTDIKENQGLPEPWQGGDSLPQTDR